MMPTLGTIVETCGNQGKYCSTWDKETQNIQNTGGAWTSGVGIVTGIANKTLFECLLEQDREIYGTWSYIHVKVVVSK